MQEAKSAPAEDFFFLVCMLGAQQAPILESYDEIEGSLT